MSNAGTLAEALIAKGHKLASGRTDNHLVLWVLRPHGLTGSKVEKVCEAASISFNRNTVPGDASALSPGGVRIGAPAMTTRGCATEDFKRIADFLDRCTSTVTSESQRSTEDERRGVSGERPSFSRHGVTHRVSLNLGTFCFPRLQGHPEHRRQDVHHPHLQLCTAVFLSCRLLSWSRRR